MAISRKSRVSVVIATYNNADMLAGLLAQLAGQTRRPDEIIVVDNASTDHTAQLALKPFPGLRYRRMARNTGSAGGYHEGIRIALENSDYIWILDDDVFLEPDSLEALLKGLADMEKAGLAEIGAVRSVGPGYTGGVPAELVVAPWRGTLFKTATIRKIGLPRKDYFLYGEDLEYSLRRLKHGYRCFWVPDSRCAENRLSGKISRRVLGRFIKIYSASFRLYYAFRNEVYTYLKYRKLVKLVQLAVYALKVAVYLSVSEGSGGLRKARAVAAGFFDGIIGRLGENPAYTPE